MNEFVIDILLTTHHSFDFLETRTNIKNITYRPLKKSPPPLFAQLINISVINSPSLESLTYTKTEGICTNHILLRLHKNPTGVWGKVVATQCRIEKKGMF